MGHSTRPACILQAQSALQSSIQSSVDEQDSQMEVVHLLRRAVEKIVKHRTRYPAGDFSKDASRLAGVIEMTTDWLDAAIENTVAF